MNIVLTEVEVMLAYALSAARTAENRKRGVRDRQIGKDNPLYTEANGIGGEIAVAKAFNVYPDLTVSARSGGYDLVVEGSRVDVKTTHHENGKLLATLKENPDVDEYIHVVGSLPEYRIVGRVPKELLINESNIKNLGHGEGYALSQEEIMAYEKHPDEIGVLFEKQSSKGTVYYSGKLNGQDVVGFVKQDKNGKNRIELKKSQPREGQPSKPKPTMYSDESIPVWGDLEKAPF